MRKVCYILGVFLLVGAIAANPLSHEEDEEVPIKSSYIESLPIGEKQPYYDGNDDSKELQIHEEDDEDEDKLIGMEETGTNPLLDSAQNQTTSAPDMRGYDSRPTQSAFVDDLPHPTISHRPDPRFAVQPRTCAENQYLCRKASPNQEHVRCIPNEWKCNGVRDCEEMDDEEDCGPTSQPQTTYYDQCNNDQYKCRVTNICIRRDQVCDGRRDCHYDDDESNCADQYNQRRQPQVSHSPEIPMMDPYPSYTRPVPQPETRFVEPPLYHTGQNGAGSNYPPQQPECPKPMYSDEQVKKFEWVNRCVKTCMSKA